jgi:hypothetical protein
MGSLKDLVQNSPVHERNLKITTYPVDEGRLVVEGWLRDERLVKGFHWDGRERLPGVVHWLCVRLLVGGWPVSILDAEAEMPVIPHDLCPTVADSVKKIIGVNIVSGFSTNVRKRMGGVEGCAHLTSLIVAMGPAALHGYWTEQSQRRRPLPFTMEDFPGLRLLTNSCYLWRKDGPLLERVRKTIENRSRKEDSP